MNNIEIDYKKPCVYQIKHKESGKIYIGSTTLGLRKRIYAHHSKHGNCTKLRNAIQKYGKDAFVVIVLEYCNKENTIEREQYWVDILQPFNENGYNLARTAGRPTLGRVFSLETRKKLSDAHKGKVRTKEHNENLKRSLNTPETKLKMCSWQIGKVVSEETKSKIRNSLQGRKNKPHSEETKQKMRDFHKSRKENIKTP